METSNSKKCLDIVLTDIKTHVLKSRKPQLFYRKIMKLLRNKNKSTERVYGGKIFDNKKGQPSFSINLFKDFEKIIEYARKKGMTKIRVFAPSEGLKVYPGKDVFEYLEAKEKRKIKK